MSLKTSYSLLFLLLIVTSGAHSQNLYSAFTNNLPASIRVTICEEPDPDTDGDGVCDSMDPCPADNPDDSDSDGVCDSDDICPGGNDSQDQDADGIPDLCDFCPLDNPDDSDFDGVCDSDDTCPGGNDFQDQDADGIPDFCDVCPLDNPDDTDGDGICESDDVCFGDNVTGDSDSDGVCDDLDNCLADYNPSQTDSNIDGIGNVCDPMNICTGPAAVLENMLHSSDVYCAAEDSITAGGADPVPGDVTVSPTGDVVYTAPVIELIPSFRVQSGGIFSAGDDLLPALLCTETCQFTNDGDCDDGGPGSDFSSCPLGTDCLDCGPR